jgi:hypothetical protein
MSDHNADKLSPEAAKILQARRDAATELKAIDQVERPLSDPAVIRLAGARLYEAAITLRVLDGERIPASEIKASDDLIIAARGNIKTPVQLSVKFVDGYVGRGTCPHCKQEFEIEDYRAPSLPEPKPAPSINPPSATEPSARATPAPTNAIPANAIPEAANVVPMPERKSPGIHDAVAYLGGDEIRPPLKRLEPREPWIGFRIT